MMKKVWAMALAVVMILGLAPAIDLTASAATGTWELVTDASTLKDGDEVLIVCPSKDKAMGASDSKGNYRTGVDVTITDNAIAELPAGAVTAILEVHTEGSFAFKVSDGYLYWTSGNYVQTQANYSTKSDFTITIGADATTDTAIKNVLASTRKLQWNASSPRFACYTSTQTAICLFKQNTGDAPACEHLNVTDVPEIEAGEDTYGYTAGTKCNDCGEYTSGGELIPKKGYLVSYSVPTFATAPEAENAASGSVQLPEMDDVGQYTFIGWAESSVADTTTMPTIHEQNTKFTPTARCTLYAVYSHIVEEDAGSSEVELYEKVTTAPADWSGEYLIVYENTNGKAETPVIFNGSLSTLDAAHNNVPVAIVDSTITLTANHGYQFTIAAMDGGYSIQSASGKYIGQTSDKNGLAAQDAALKNTITLNGDDVDIVSGGAYLRFNATANDTSDRFRYYKSTSYTNQQAIALYKKGTAPSSGTISTLYYTSSISGVAVVDGVLVSAVPAEITGDVTLLENVTVADLTLPEGATLDLSGNTLTVTGTLDGLTNNGQITGAGKIYGDVMFNKNNAALPITVTDGSEIYTVLETPDVVEKNNAAAAGAESHKFSFYVNDKAASTWLDEAVNAGTVKIIVRVSYNDGMARIQDFELDAALAAAYVAAWDDKQINLNLTGLTGLTDVSCETVLVSGNVEY